MTDWEERDDRGVLDTCVECGGHVWSQQWDGRCARCAGQDFDTFLRRAVSDTVDGGSGEWDR